MRSQATPSDPPTEGAPVDIKTASALHRLRLVSAPEAVSFLLLLVCSVLKRTTDVNAVPVMGAIHGILFILYVIFWADAWNKAKWPVKTAALYFVLSVLPFGGFVAERKLKRQAEDALIAARARKEGVVGA
ncbi:membrane protein [Streptomyces melanogenes]|nr:membrane protein [Streptomyces melanogenes]